MTGHEVCALCGVRCTVATADGVVVDDELRQSHCRRSKYGSHKWRVEA